MHNLIENYKKDIIINEGTKSEVRISNALAMIFAGRTDEEMEQICNKLNTEKPAEYNGHKIDWDKIAYFSYDKDVNKELIW